jgi:hypothetical protein
MKLFSSLSLIILQVLLIFGCGSSVKVIDQGLSIEESREFIINSFEKDKFSFEIPGGTKVKEIIIDSSNRSIEIILNKNFSYRPFRKESVNKIYGEVKKLLPVDYADYDLKVFSLSMPIEELIPNIFRNDSTDYDFDRMPFGEFLRDNPLVFNLSRNRINGKSILPVNGLFNKNIALWHSHGWYHDVKSDRWLWQRPRLFQTVEDLVPMSVTLPYLIPMLEKAGANVFIPRERDFQLNEIIVDNDNPEDNYSEYASSELNRWRIGAGAGFSLDNPPYEVNHNPFTKGTHKIITSAFEETAWVKWTPRITHSGKYAVYVSYAASVDNVNDAVYIVGHAAGSDTILVNQTIGGNTWVYLGKFNFLNNENDSTEFWQGVHLSNHSSTKGKIVSADGVRFGGGMGVVARGGSTSGRPKFLEGAKYYLQYAGMPDTLVYNLNENKNDYNDDYQSRGEYVNYLKGAPFGPNKNRFAAGLGIPMDLSLAFHTDAGITRNDTTIGTLMIYSIEDADSNLIFPDGMSRLANRDLGDIVQTQIVNDIRAKYDPVWSRRGLREAQYSEAFRPNVPAILLELLSHQNFLDMKFMLDPRFKFDVARSIYKGMLRFLSVQYNFEYIVQPLKPTHLMSEMLDDKKIKISWRPQLDPLEPTAVPQMYKVYIGETEKGYKPIAIVSDTFYVHEVNSENEILNFKVSAMNKGGESFTSEVISFYKNGPDSKTVLIINGFDRISGPASIESDQFTGFLNFQDAGVPDHYDLGFTGTQIDYNPNSKYLTNDYPGHGNSHANYETMIIAGNTFDFSTVHGAAIKNAGYSFVTVSDEAVTEGLIDLTKYDVVDLILGEEKETPFPKAYGDSLNGKQFKTFTKALQERITHYLNAGGNIFISGAYVGSDLFNISSIDTNDVNFAASVLKFNWAASHASKDGNIFSADSSFGNKNFYMQFNTELNDIIYAVEAPDAINPVNGSKSVFRYSENGFGAGTAFKEKYGVIALGFPFETILGEQKRNDVMKMILKYLE